ncbi:ATP-binding protein [Algoriphagus namhaensis]|uniref:ATP-binding protein n=1 Tax=Algoriphagus namhaensis TaxID=915353 RepID=A0ABV8AMV7_9BACT
MSHALKLYCQTSSLAELRKFIQMELQETGISDALQLQLTLAVEEVCANLIIHSHNCDATEHITVDVIKSTQAITFEIIDDGNAFNLLEYQVPDLQTVMDAKRKGGLGIILIKKIMDKIEFISNGSTNTCRLTKKISS